MPQTIHSKLYISFFFFFCFQIKFSAYPNLKTVLFSQLWIPGFVKPPFPPFFCKRGRDAPSLMDSSLLGEMSWFHQGLPVSSELISGRLAAAAPSHF